jgi:hypothetical protein
LLSKVFLPVQKCKHFLNTVPGCVCRLNYTVRNNKVTCYIAVYGLSNSTKLYTIIYRSYQFVSVDIIFQEEITILRVTLLSMVCLTVQYCTQLLITVPVCVSRLTYAVRNNHTTCYIAVYGLPISTKLYTFSYHLTSLCLYT